MADVPVTPELEERLQAVLDEQYQRAGATALDDNVSNERERAIDYYLGRVTNLGSPGVGRSKVISQDVSDVIDGLMPGLLEVVLGEPPVSFAPVGPDDDRMAEQETSAVEHVLHIQNAGFLAIHDAMKSGLMEKNGYVKVFTRRRSRIETETINNVTDEVIAALGDGEVTEKTAAGVDPMTGLPIYDVVIAREVKFDEVIVKAVPSEDVRVSPDCSGAIEDSRYVAHDVQMTADELRDLGVADDLIAELSAAAPEGDSPEKTARRGAASSTATAAASSREVGVYDITEHFVTVALNEGEASQKLIVHTQRGASRVLKVQIVEDHDFASWAPIRIPHRHAGRSVADKTVPYADIKTSLLRNLMDGFYHSVNPRPIIGDDIANAHTLDDYLMVQPGRPIRTAKTLPLPMYQPLPTMQHAGPILEMMDARQEYSTGFSRAGTSIDKNSFNSTATGAGILATAQQATQKLYARMFVENCLTRVYKLVHRHLRASSIQVLPIQVADQWQEVSPREWKERRHIRVNVNLGPSTKQQDQQAAVGLIQVASQVIQMQRGTNGPFLFPSNVHEILRNFLEAHGKKNFSRFIADPTQPMTPERAQQLGAQPQPAEPPEAPEVTAAKVQAQAFAEVEKMKAEIKAQTTIHVEQIKGQVDLAIERMKASMDQQIESVKALLGHRAALHEQATRPQPAQFPTGAAT